MSNEIAIRVDKLSKKYHLRYPFSGNEKNQTQELWALKDINFELRRGESVGIIGPNGSGKSTLLKVLSGITSPTSGSVEINGRVAAILDIGSGFHPDLSGRENIFLSGNLMGMYNQEIHSAYTSIVEFSGLSDFIETPVKYYSSGMFIRLAFSIIAFLEADIMIFDEVIAVGDAEFSYQCKKKLEELIQKKKTVIIASHNMNELFNYCGHTIRLDKGIIISEGDTGTEVSRYLEAVYDKQQYAKNNNNPLENKSIFPNTQSWKTSQSPVGNDSVRLNSITILSEKEKENAVFVNDEDINIEIDYDVVIPNSGEVFAIAIHSIDGSPVFVSEADFNTIVYEETGRCKATCVIQKRLFNAGIFCVSAGRILKDKFMRFPVELSFKIKLCDSDKNVTMQYALGPVKPKLNWIFKQFKL